MIVSWKKNFDPNVITSRLNKICEVMEDGSLQLNNFFDYRNCLVCLLSCIDFEYINNESVRYSLINKATSDLIKKGNLNSKNLINLLNKYSNIHTKQKSDEYYFVSTISINNQDQIKSKRFNGSHISIKPFLKETFFQENSRLKKEHAPSYVRDKKQSSYQYITVKTFAHSYHEAFDESLNAVDLYRAILNLFCNYGGVRQSSGKRDPVNPIILGPIHTLHKKSGKAAEEVCWYEPNYGTPINAYRIGPKLEKFYKFEMEVRNVFKRIKYAPSIKSGLLRYVRALDSYDWDSSYLKLWSALEYLTDTANDNYDKTIKRASFLYRDREYIKQTLNHLRFFRNRSVHESETSEYLETVIYQLKIIVEGILVYHIRSKFNFGGFEEANRFLDLPADQEILKSKIKDMRNALKFIS